MNKKPSLLDALQAKSGKVEKIAPRQEILGMPPSRQGKKALTTWHNPAVIQQIKMIAAEENKTVQELVAEGLNLMFSKHGRKQIA